MPGMSTLADSYSLDTRIFFYVASLKYACLSPLSSEYTALVFPATPQVQVL